MYKYLENYLSSYKKPINHGTIESLELQWTKKYLQNLDVNFRDRKYSESLDFNQVMSQAGREITPQKLRTSMVSVSLQAWNKTGQLLSKEVKRHSIKPYEIETWEIAGDSFKIYDKAPEINRHFLPPHKPSMVIKSAAKKESLFSSVSLRHTERLAPTQLIKAISSSLRALRRKYIRQYPQVIGFVSTSCITSKILLQLLSHTEQKLLSNYFKVVDDYLYIPLRRAYTAAAKLDYKSLGLSALEHLLTHSTDIAKSISKKVIKLYSAYPSYFVNLNHKKVITSSILDVETFQVYLWVCALEGDISVIQQKLFSLWVMLYSTSKVSWEIIRQMLHLLEQQISERLDTEEANTLMPYSQVMKAYVF